MAELTRSQRVLTNRERQRHGEGERDREREGERGVKEAGAYIRDTRESFE